eukprot:CAMPEP_0178753448 /NCGR_PEP_ID=MMETSP0744-20121128/11615_1 /TAXON_ID=913974 /ORGANISM="Nitzschia punctata, Strain CCMP561" /LENGTH=268 /DNA_ID=CAMNT_0020407261 /DNA_START=53 /DNA_END=859 /DNA_ORIENTATION=-
MAGNLDLLLVQHYIAGDDKADLALPPSNVCDTLDGAVLSSVEYVVSGQCLGQNIDPYVDTPLSWRRLEIDENSNSCQLLYFTDPECTNLDWQQACEDYYTCDRTLMITRKGACIEAAEARDNFSVPMVRQGIFLNETLCLDGQASSDVFFPVTEKRCDAGIALDDDSTWYETSFTAVCSGDTMVVEGFSNVLCDGEPISTVEYALGCSESAFGNDFRRSTGCSNPTIFCSGLENKELPVNDVSAGVEFNSAIGHFVAICVFFTTSFFF